MTLGERLKEQRTKSGLSQEKIAEMVGVSRQAVTKWEANQSAPSSENLITLASIYHISLDELAIHDVKRKKSFNPILRSNLTWIAIIFQASALSTCARIPQSATDVMSESGKGFFAFQMIILLFCSVWMVRNLFFENDLKQRKKNIQIELCYCIVQASIALFVFYSRQSFIGAAVMIAVCLFYILIINPKYMRRAFLKKDHPENK